MPKCSHLPRPLWGLVGFRCGPADRRKISGVSHGFIVGHVTPESRLAARSHLFKKVTSLLSMPIRIFLRWLSATPSLLYARRSGFTTPKSDSRTLYKYIKKCESASKAALPTNSFFSHSNSDYKPHVVLGFSARGTCARASSRMWDGMSRRQLSCSTF